MTYVNRPTVTTRGSTHMNAAFMGLTSSGGVTVACKLQPEHHPAHPFFPAPPIAPEAHLHAVEHPPRPN